MTEKEVNKQLDELWHKSTCGTDYGSKLEELYRGAQHELEAEHQNRLTLLKELSERKKRIVELEKQLNIGRME